jgi:hypothetical protein
MKTKIYNPSSIEIQFAEIFLELKDSINEKLTGNEIQNVLVDTKKDNPDLVFELEDNDGDKHEIVIKIIQRAGEA